MHFRLTYNQREASRGSGNFGYSNFGPKWVCDWVDYLTFSEFLSDGVTLNVPGGGSEFYPRQYYNGPFYPAFQSRATLTQISQDPDPRRFARTLPDGTTQIFDLESDVGGGSTRFYMTQIVDPAGKAVHLTYDSSLWLTTVTDAAGSPPMTITYASTNPADSNYYLIKTITDPLGDRPLLISIQTKITSLWIHDSVGITSQFVYATASDSCGNPVNGVPTPVQPILSRK